MATRTERERPFGNTKLTKFLDKHIDGLKGELSQRDIATALGYRRANLISMLKAGDMSLPLEKVPALAKAIKVDPAHLLRLGLEEHWPDQMRVINEVFGGVVTKNEMKLLEAFRSATHSRDPQPTREQVAQIQDIFRGH